MAEMAWRPVMYAVCIVGRLVAMLILVLKWAAFRLYTLIKGGSSNDNIYLTCLNLDASLLFPQ